MRWLLLLAALAPCNPCAGGGEPLSIAEGTYVERDEPRLVDAQIVIEEDVITVEYTGDDGERYLATYAVVSRSGG